MTEQQLIQLGFKKKKMLSEYWFELKHKQHKFISNDTITNKGKDEWFIGYEHKGDVYTFWFSENLRNEADFKVIFCILTGSEIN